MKVHQTKPVSEKVPNGMADSGAWEGARRATGHAPESAAPPQAGGASNEVIAEVAKRSRRRFTNAEKRRILAAADRCTQPGELGALLRKEGVYSSSLSTWRRQREQAELDALAPAKRGPKVPANRAEVQQIARLTKEVGRLQSELDKALLVIGVQKKLATLLGRSIVSAPPSTSLFREGYSEFTMPDGSSRASVLRSRRRYWRSGSCA